MQWIYFITVNVHGIYSSLAEAFTVSLAGACSQPNPKLYHNQPGETKNRTNLHLEPHDYRIYYINIDYVICMEFLLLKLRCPSWQTSLEQGDSAVFAGKLDAVDWCM